MIYPERTQLKFKNPRAFSETTLLLSPLFSKSIYPPKVKKETLYHRAGKRKLALLVQRRPAERSLHTRTITIYIQRAQHQRVGPPRYNLRPRWILITAFSRLPSFLPITARAQQSGDDVTRVGTLTARVYTNVLLCPLHARASRPELIKPATWRQSNVQTCCMIYIYIYVCVCLRVYRSEIYSPKAAALDKY